MPDLAAAYDRTGDEGRRAAIALGLTAFFAGVVALLVGILVATTPLGSAWGLDRYGARRVAGVLAGVAIPTIFAGIVTVLPASRRERAKVAVGVLLALCGVVLFWFVYPERWIGWSENHLTFPVTAIYAIGGFVGLWYVLQALATFRQRNDPRGTVTLEVERDGETQTIEVSPDELDRRSVEEIAAEAHDERS
jgi:MFS family permease